MLPIINMMTSSNCNIFPVTGPLCWEFTGEFPAQRPVSRSFDVFFDPRLNNNRETDDLRRHRAHYDVIVMKPRQNTTNLELCVHCLAVYMANAAQWHTYYNYVCTRRNIEKHTAHTIVSLPNPKQWIIVHTSHLMMIITQSIYLFSQSSQGKWVNRKHTAPHIV